MKLSHPELPYTSSHVWKKEQAKTITMHKLWFDCYFEYFKCFKNNHKTKDITVVKCVGN